MDAQALLEVAQRLEVRSCLFRKPLLPMLFERAHEVIIGLRAF